MEGNNLRSELSIDDFVDLFNEVDLDKLEEWDSPKVEPTVWLAEKHLRHLLDDIWYLGHSILSASQESNLQVVNDLALDLRTAFDTASIAVCDWVTE